MKYALIVSVSVLLLISHISFVNAQILNTDYVREVESQREVLGVETMDMQLDYEAEEEEEGLNFEMIDIFAVLGGIAIIAVVAYTVYSNKEE